MLARVPFPDLSKPRAGTCASKGGNQTDVPDTQNPGLAMTLVPKGTTETPTIVTKRKAGLGTQTRGGLGAMRSSSSSKQQQAASSEQQAAAAALLATHTRTAARAHSSTHAQQHAQRRTRTHAQQQRRTRTHARDNERAAAPEATRDMPTTDLSRENPCSWRHPRAYASD